MVITRSRTTWLKLSVLTSAIALSGCQSTGLFFAEKKQETNHEKTSLELIPVPEETIVTAEATTKKGARAGSVDTAGTRRPMAAYSSTIGV